MKKQFLLILVLIVGLTAQAQTDPIYEQIKNINGVSNCERITSTDGKNVVYSFNFTQHLGRNFLTHETDTTSFTTRAIAVINDVDKPTAFYVSGYNLPLAASQLAEGLQRYPQMIVPDIMYNYEGANLVIMEHRYFGDKEVDPLTGAYITAPGKTSYPEDLVDNIGFLCTENAAEDFHNIITAFKENLLRGKTIMTGGSKGGITTSLQALYHPEDVDVYLPYSAPYSNSLKDPRYYEWLYDSIQPGSSEIRKQLKNYTDFLMNDKTDNNYVYKEYSRLRTAWYMKDDRYKNNPAYVDSLVQCDYEDKAFGYIGWNLFAYNTREVADYYMQIDSLHTSTGISELEVYAFWNAKIASSVNDPDWKEKAVGSPVVRGVKRRLPMTEADWNRWSLTPAAEGALSYFFQGSLEEGDVYYPYKEYYPNCMTVALNQKNAIDSLRMEYGQYYTHSTYERLFDYLKTAKENILFIYGGDDPWVGGRIEDEYLTAENVYRYILPSQGHSCAILRAPEELRNEILQTTLFKWLGDPATSIDVAKSQEPRAKSNAIYNLAGQKVGADYKGVVIINGKKYLK